MTARRTKGKEREELVVEAATQAIVERGLANVRIADIAELAGMTPGHVTYYFPSKIDLLMRAIGASEEALASDVAQKLGRVKDPWKRLDKLVELSAASGRGDPGWVLWFQVWSEAARDMDVARVHDELDARWRGILTDVIRYGVEQGAFATDDPAESALLLSSTIDGLSIHLTVGSPDVSRARLLRLSRAAAEAYLSPPR
jgi:AcrR family transcriptional regulator